MKDYTRLDNCSIHSITGSVTSNYSASGENSLLKVSGRANHESPTTFQSSAKNPRLKNFVRAMSEKSKSTILAVSHYIKLPGHQSSSTNRQNQARSEDASLLPGGGAMTMSLAVSKAIEKHDGDLLTHQGRMRNADEFILNASRIVDPDKWNGESGGPSRQVQREILANAPRYLTAFVNEIGSIPTTHSHENPGKSRRDTQLNALAVAHKAFEFIDRHMYMTEVTNASGETTKKFWKSSVPNSLAQHIRKADLFFDADSRNELALAVAKLCLDNADNPEWKTPHAQDYMAEVQFNSGVRSRTPHVGTLVQLALSPITSSFAVMPQTKRQDKTLNHAVDLLIKVVKSFDKPGSRNAHATMNDALIKKCVEVIEAMPANSETRVRLYDTLKSRVDQEWKITVRRDPSKNS